MSWKNLVTVAVLSMALPALAQAGPDQPAASPPSLTVNGSGEVRADPDQAVVRLGLLVQETAAREAQARANESGQKILAALLAAGVPRSAIQTAELTLSPVYSPQDLRSGSPSAEEPRIVAYRASNVVSVRLEDLSLVGKAIDAGLGAGANRLEGVDFSLRDDTAVRQQALEKAVAEARSKAETIARALGVRLVGILEVNEGGVSIVTPRFAQSGILRMSQAATAPATPIEAGQVTVSANVTVRYHIAGP